MNNDLVSIEKTTTIAVADSTPKNTQKNSNLKCENQ